MLPGPLFSLSDLGDHRHFLVGFSGGLDSTVLLHQLVALRAENPALSIRAVHVHHGLSAHADAWLAHCRQLCQLWDVEFIACHVAVSPNGKGVEAAAREVRYQAIEAVLAPDEALLTAQHLDDQSETFLLALKRGSGPAGLSAMPREMQFSGRALLRPLLSLSRTELEHYARAAKLHWIDDDSNTDTRYDRNFLRLTILPELKQRWPHFTQAVARSAQLCAEQEQLLDELLAEELEALVQPDSSLQIAPLNTMSEVRRAAILRRWLACLGAKMPSREQLKRLWYEVAVSREDAIPCLHIAPWEVRRFQGALYLVKPVSIPRNACIPWEYPLTPLQLPAGCGQVFCREVPGNGLAVRPATDDEKVSIRFTASGLLHIVGRDKGRELKKIWQELGVAPWKRRTVPLLFYNEQLIAAAGYFITQQGEPGPDQWYFCWQPE
jgi:tRNA(Ile)-lysidine synthase